MLTLRHLIAVFLSVVFPASLFAMQVTVTTTAAHCGFDNGTASVHVIGGVGPFSCSWDNGAMGFTITGLAPGTYTATLTDAQGTSVEASGTVVAQFQLGQQSL